MATNSAAHLFRKSLADQILSQRLQNQWPRGFKLMNLIRVLTLMKPRLKITCQEISYNGLTSPFGTSRLPGATVIEDGSTVHYTDLCAVGTGTKCSGLWHLSHRFLTYLTSRLRDWIKLVSLVSGIPPWPSVTLNLTAVPCVSCRFHPPPFSVFQGRLWTLNGTATIAWLHFNCQNGFATAAQCSQQDIVAKQPQLFCVAFRLCFGLDLTRSDSRTFLKFSHALLQYVIICYIVGAFWRFLNRAQSCLYSILTQHSRKLSEKLRAFLPWEVGNQFLNCRELSLYVALLARKMNLLNSKHWRQRWKLHQGAANEVNQVS